MPISYIFCVMFFRFNFNKSKIVIINYEQLVGLSVTISSMVCVMKLLNKGFPLPYDSIVTLLLVAISWQWRITLICKKEFLNRAYRLECTQKQRVWHALTSCALGDGKTECSLGDPFCHRYINIEDFRLWLSIALTSMYLQRLYLDYFLCALCRLHYIQDIIPPTADIFM